MGGEDISFLQEVVFPEKYLPRDIAASANQGPCQISTLEVIALSSSYICLSPSNGCCQFVISLSWLSSGVFYFLNL